MSITSTPLQPRCVTGDAALRVAHADAEKVYSDLCRYRMIVFLEPDGWHLDYQLKSSTALGGGPLYLIDAATGTIAEKRKQ
jgi:hypothetical protein